MKEINEILEKAVPELQKINLQSEKNGKWLTLSQWGHRIKGIEYQNKKNYGKSYLSPILEKYLEKAVCRRDGQELILVNENAYKVIRKYLTSREFVETLEEK